MTDTYKIVERLEAAARATHKYNDGIGSMVLDEVAGRATDAVSTIEALAEALEPFAKCAATFDAYMSGSDSIRLSINCADLRRARSALNLLKGEGVTAQPPTDGGSDAG